MYTKTQARIQADIKQTNWERRLYIAMKINQGRTHQSIAKELKITRQAVSEIWKKIKDMSISELEKYANIGFEKLEYKGKQANLKPKDDVLYEVSVDFKE